MKKTLSNRKLAALAVMSFVSVSGVVSAYGWWVGHDDPIVGDDAIQKAWNYETKNWMKDIPDSAKLGEITLVSSHDAGMNENRAQDPHVPTVSACHFHSLYEQMCDGARFFDIRPAWFYAEPQEFRCMHGGDFGHAIHEVMNDAVQFVTNNPTETVVLKFSHWYDHEIVDQRRNCMQYIMENPNWTNWFYRSSAKPAPLLNQVPLSELRGKILFLLDWDVGSAEEPENCYDHAESVALGCTPENGIWKFGEVSAGSKGIYGYYRIYDSYPESYDYQEIVCDQYAKWARFEQNMDPNTNAFMLCWQSTYGGIYLGAANINPLLDHDLKCLVELVGARPGLINLDYIDRNICKTAINVNYQLINPQPLPPVTYLEPQFGERGEVTGYAMNTLTHYSILNGAYTAWFVGLYDRWYVVSTNGCSLGRGADVAENCHARIILRDGTLLTSYHEDFDNGPSIDVEKTGAALTIYGQSTSTNVMGRLEVQGDNQGAGIGAGNNHDGKRITINGGKVTARGGQYASGIGGGNEGSGYDITVNGGWVLAYGGENGAGIGGGRNRNGYGITINGGLVEAISGGKSAGIGGGYAGEGHHITINGGYTRVVGKDGGAGIGGGEQHNGGGAGYAITVNGGTVDADEVYHAYNLGHGNDGAEPVDNEVAITGGSIWAPKTSTCWGLKNPTNAVGQMVYEVTVPSVQTAGRVSVTGLGAYGVNDLYAFDSKLKFYLPNGAYHFWAGDTRYDVTVNNGTATSQTSAAVDESATYVSQEAAQAAAANAYVARPNDQVAGVVTAEAYDGMFVKKTVKRSGSTWGIQPELTTATTNEVTQAISSSEVASKLVSTITNAVPTTRVQTTAGLYYGMSGAVDVQAIGAATPSSWELGDGTEKEIRGARPAGATDKAFYQLRVTTKP